MALFKGTRIHTTARLFITVTNFITSLEVTKSEYAVLMENGVVLNPDVPVSKKVAKDQCL